MKAKKDYCTWFPEYIRNIYIGDCCKEHDYNVVRKTVKFSTKKFYKCLREKNGVGRFWATIIAFGGTVGHIVKYPIFYYKRKKNGN